MTADLRIDDCALTRRVERMEALVGRKAWHDAADYFTADVHYQVAHAKPYIGIAGIRAYLDYQNMLVRWEGHAVRSKFSRGNVVFIEVESHFTRVSDGTSLTVPCTDVYAFDGERICDWRVYADTSVFRD